MTVRWDFRKMAVLSVGTWKIYDFGGCNDRIVSVKIGKTTNIKRIVSDL